MHETLRTQGFREQMASPEAPQEGDFEPKPLYLKRLGDVEHFRLEGESDGPESCQFGEMLPFQFCFTLLMFLIDFGVSAGSKSCILLI